MSDHKHSKKHKKQQLIGHQRHQQEINQMTADQARSRNLDEEREEELREAALASARIAEKTSDGKPVWSAKVQMIRNKNTGRLRAGEGKWNRFAGTSGGGERVMMRRGFSLVELSMVLVIIGLLVGAVTVGQSLIRSSHLRAIGEEGQRYISAVANFRDQYNGLPGDIMNATTYWGQAAAGAACITTIGTGTTTCNGDGDALLTNNGTTSNEYMRFWQQLANAGLIDGKYTGVKSDTDVTSTSSANAPGSRLGPTALWAVNYWGARAADTRMFNGSYGNSLWINGFTTNSFPFTPLINPEEAWNIDSKLDDGMPGIGNIVSVQANINTCTNMANPATVTALYLINSATPGCGIMFRNAF